MPPFTIADNDPRGRWIAQDAWAMANDYSDSVVVTVEPLPTQKNDLAVEGGEPAEQLHVTLAFLVGGVADLGDEGRQAISTALAGIADATPPFEGDVTGVGWFDTVDTITLALIDAPGLAALRTVIADQLAAVGYPLDMTHDFIPHMTLAYGQVEAAEKVGMPLTFNEIRLRWGTDVLAFDLMGIPMAPEAPPVQSPEIAPTTTEPPIEETAPVPEEAAVDEYVTVENHPACQGSPDGPVALLDADGNLVSCHMTIDEGETKATELEATIAPTGPVPPPVASPAIVAAVKAAVEERRLRRAEAALTDMADEIPAAETAPEPPMEGETDLAMMSDDELATEIAHRIAVDAVGEGGDPTAVEAAILAEIQDALAEVREEVVGDAVSGPEEADEVPPIGPAAGAVSADPVTMGQNRAARRREARARAKTKVTLANEGIIAPVDPDKAVDPDMPSLYEFESVLTVEGTPSGDGRFIAEGCLTWRNLPLPLMLQTVNAPGHDGSIFCGWISDISRDGQAIMGRGNFAKGAAGDAARDILNDPASAGRFGVSVDIDSVTVVFADPTGVEMSPDEAIEAQMFGGMEVVEMMISGRIMGATMTPFPAFQEAFVYLLGPVEGGQPLDQTPALVASIQGELWRSTIPAKFSLNGSTPTEALVASAAGPDPDAPPAAWFSQQPMDEPMPFTVFPDGRCYGLVAQWGTCHIGNSRRCIPVPRSNDFRSFYTGKKVLTREGTMVAVGPIFMDTVHPNLLAQASDAQAFYAHTGCAAADVRLFTNEHGILAAGAIRPDATPSQVRRLRASDISPDWRPISGEHKLVSLLAVNTSGFLVEGIAASAGRFQPWGAFNTVDNQLGALVAAGAIHQERNDAVSLRAEIEALRADVFALSTRVDSRDSGAERRARVAAAAATLRLSTGCGCGGEAAMADAGAAAPETDPDDSRFIDDGVGLIIDGERVS